MAHCWVVQIARGVLTHLSLDAGTYQTAILENRVDFEGKVVMDVGAGSGILSLFAVQAGAAKVYAVEASEMATYARQLADQNAGNQTVKQPSSDRSHLRSSSIDGDRRCSGALPVRQREQVRSGPSLSELPVMLLQGWARRWRWCAAAWRSSTLTSRWTSSSGAALHLASPYPVFFDALRVSVRSRLKADASWLTFHDSEPMGTLLVNERMLETYVYARKRFLKPGGKMFPQVGRIHVAAFSDEVLYGELVSKAAFWLQVRSLACTAMCVSSRAACGCEGWPSASCHEHHIPAAGEAKCTMLLPAATGQLLWHLHQPAAPASALWLLPAGRCASGRKALQLIREYRPSLLCVQCARAQFSCSQRDWSTQVVVDAIDPSVLVSRAETKLYDFGAIEAEELHDISIPLDLQISARLLQRHTVTPLHAMAT